jgi:phosphate/sulfate permease
MNFEFLDGTLGFGDILLLALCLIIALGFEVVNGFHDTANAVATVIYTRSLRPTVAVVWSGICNFCGVFLGGIAVALAIVHLLPVDLLVAGGSGGALSAVLALLLAAVVWNLGTWFYGLPSSSSHALIGAILGVGLANSVLPGHVFGSGVNWDKAKDVALSLLLSPLFGFAAAAGLLWVTKKFIHKPELYAPAPEGARPPGWIRAILIVTCTGVSFAHGSNDGQKGVGLIMLVLIGLLPGYFALNMQGNAEQMKKATEGALYIQEVFRRQVELSSPADVIRQVQQPSQGTTIASLDGQMRSLSERIDRINLSLAGHARVGEIPVAERWDLRRSILEVDNAIGALQKSRSLRLTTVQEKELTEHRANLRAITDYAPFWVLLAVALALGIGTMIGWQRIVVTVGEKIGMDHLSYAQGAAAELVAMSTIGLSTMAGLPVSTTHVLASGVAGTMVANNTGLQNSTIKRIAMAWLLTLPVCMLLAGAFFLLFRLLV